MSIFINNEYWAINKRMARVAKIYNNISVKI